MLKIKEIIPNPYQIRRKFDIRELETLAESLKEVGMISPLIVRRSTCGYELICGQRRLRAALMAKIEEVPAIIISAGDAQCAEISMIENIHRKNIGIFEEADGFYNLMMYHGVKKEKLQKDLSVDPLKIIERIQILNLTADQRNKIETSGTDERHIKQVLRIHNDVERMILINKIIGEKMSVCETEKYVNEYLKENLIATSEKPVKKKITKDKSQIFNNTIQKTVEILKKYGAKVDFVKNDTEEYVEYCIKTMK